MAIDYFGLGGGLGIGGGFPGPGGPGGTGLSFSVESNINHLIKCKVY